MLLENLSVNDKDKIDQGMLFKGNKKHLHQMYDIRPHVILRAQRNIR